MSKLPEKYPEYMIMYETLSKKIQRLKKSENMKEIEIQIKIQNYELELKKIKKMFPENFFEELN